VLTVHLFHVHLGFLSGIRSVALSDEVPQDELVDVNYIFYIFYNTVVNDGNGFIHVEGRLTRNGHADFMLAGVWHDLS
jgi:hypothetical protein